MYSLWFREKHGENLESYARYVEVATCRCVVHSEFMAGSVTWDVIEFEP